MFHMNVDSAMEFYRRVGLAEAVEKHALNEEERTDILLQMAQERLIESVIGTDRSKEQIVQDAAKHGKVLHIDADGKPEIK